MTLEEIQKNSEHWYEKYKELKEQIEDIKANCDLAIEGRDIKIDELEEKNSQMFNTIALQEQQIEKMKCCENCKHSNTTCESYTICTIGHYDDCRSNKEFNNENNADYWELAE